VKNQVEPQLIYCNAPYSSPTEKLPVLIDGNNVIDSRDVWEFLNNQGFENLAVLSSENKINSNLMSNMIETKFYYSTLYFFWNTDENWNKIAQIYLKTVTSPLIGMASRMYKKIR